MNLFKQNKNSSDKNYLSLCLKEISGNIDEAEKLVLNNWLTASERNKREYEKIKNIWLNVESIKIPELPDVDTEWLKLDNRIKSETANAKEEKSKGNILSFLDSIVKPKLRPALAGTFIILIVAAIFIFRTEEINVPRYKIVSSQANEHKTVYLPDGSLVILNGSSKIKFIDGFDDKMRNVMLSGEAFFTVTKNKGPFTVVTHNARTTVLGTKFNVRAWDDETEVAVKEGRVSFEQNKINAQKVILLKNYESRIVKNQAPEPPIEVKSNIAGWIEGSFIFERTPLQNIVRELNSFYNVKIVISENKLADRTLTGKFNNNSIDSVLTMICLSMDLHLEKQSERYIIKSKNISQ